MSLKKHESLFLILLFLVGLYFSFFRLEDLYSYNYDQERDYLVIKQMVDSKKPILIGPRVVSSSGFFLGPWYYYVLLPFYLVFQGNPIFGAYMTGFVNVITSLTIFFLLKKKSSLVAFCFSLIWLTSLSHRMAWNVTFVPLFTLLLAHLLLLEKPKFKHSILASFLVGLGINFHFQIVFFAPILLAWIIYHRKTNKLSLLRIVLLAFAFLSPFFPLLAFDLRHNFVNLQSVIRFSQQEPLSNTSQTDKLIFSFRNLSREFGFALPPFNQLTIYKYAIAPLLLFLFTIKSFKDKTLRWLVAVVYISIISLFLYSQSFWPEYYQLVAVVILFVLLGANLATSRPGQIFSFILMISLIFPATLNLQKVIDGQSYRYKRDTMLYILETSKPNRPNITPDFPLGEGYGFGSIREYHEDKSLPYSNNSFLLGYSSNPKHGNDLKTFGVFGVSLLR